MLTREYPPEVYGGAGVHVDFLVRELRLLVDVDVHCLGAPREGATAHSEDDPRLADANPALRIFANELDDPSGDLVVAALILAADKSPKRLGDLLGRLAQSARDEVNMRLRVEAGRSRTRTSVKVITIFTTLFATFLIVFNRAYLEPYDSFEGQIVLGCIGLCFGGAFYWLAQSFKVDAEERFLRIDEAPA